MKPKVGFVGLGRMGSRMARNILKAGYPLTVFNRTTEKMILLVEAGAARAVSLPELAHASAVIITMVSDSDALESVVLGPNGLLAGLGRETVLIDMSTVDPKTSKRVAEAVSTAGGHFLDAPVSGSVGMAEAGSLSIMVGGSPEVHDQVRELLLSMGARTLHVGPTGAAAAMKLAVNIVIGVTMEVLGESLVLAERAGVARATAVEVLTQSAIASPFLKYKGPQLLEPAGPATFTADLMQKDLTLALELGRRLRVALPATAASNEILTMARGLGLGDLDFAVVTDVLDRVSRGSAGFPETESDNR